MSNAEGGVLAYARKPIPRSKPNNRFLQNTLKSVDFGGQLLCLFLKSLEPLQTLLYGLRNINLQLASFHSSLLHDTIGES